MNMEEGRKQMYMERAKKGFEFVKRTNILDRKEIDILLFDLINSLIQHDFLNADEN